MGDLYILNGHVPEPTEDVIEWGKWMETADRKVASTDVGSLQVSTVFLGIDHSFFGKGQPPKQRLKLTDTYTAHYGPWRSDPEVSHRLADVLMAETLRSLVYGEAMDIYEEQVKWYG